MTEDSHVSNAGVAKSIVVWLGLISLSTGVGLLVGIAWGLITCGGIILIGLILSEIFKEFK